MKDVRIQKPTRRIALISAPSNLGLRPPVRGGEPGTWRAPAELERAGLSTALKAETTVELPRPRYRPDPEPGSCILNAKAMRAFNLELAEAVEQAVSSGRKPVVVGGDCSILLGALAGIRRLQKVTLVHIDGHSDFRHPGNYDPTETPGAAAGMDLALATGRGEAVMTRWPGVDGPLVEDSNVVQLGERESRDPDWAWPDVMRTGIERVDIFEAHEIGLVRLQDRINGVIARAPGRPFWVHVDVDVLDERFMPAVDSPGRPGLSPRDLTWILGKLVRRSDFVGLSLTVYDPDLDDDGRCARVIVSILGLAFSSADLGVPRGEMGN